MTNHDDDFSYADAWKLFGLGAGAWIAIVILAIATTAGIWGIRVATSHARGTGDIRVERDSATNRVSAQAFFEDTHASVRKFDRQITDAAADLATFQADPKPDDRDLVAAQLYAQELNARRTTLSGLVHQCENAVANYNAEARKTLRADWRSPDLPYQIDTSDTTTDCKGPSS